MIIAVDAMGGDHAPREAVRGSVRAAAEDATRIALVGRAAEVERELEAALAELGEEEPRDEVADRIEIVDAPEVVEMDDPPITPIRKKRRSSIRVCAETVRDGNADAMVTAGNTGAGLIAAKMIIGTIEGVDRPALAGIFPHESGGYTVLLDVGANVDSKPAHLRQFAVMGHAYAVGILGLERPRIGLMSYGEEESKGTELTRQVFAAMKDAALNFVGNVEGGDLFNGSVDVIVCDGFVGNVVLKSSEALFNLVRTLLRDELEGSLRTQVGSLLARPAFDGVRRRLDYREFGAAPLLGVERGCFIAHGRSDHRAIHSAIRRAAEFTAAELHVKIRDEVAELHAEEGRVLGSSSQEASAQ